MSLVSCSCKPVRQREAARDRAEGTLRALHGPIALEAQSVQSCRARWELGLSKPTSLSSHKSCTAEFYNVHSDKCVLDNFN